MLFNSVDFFVFLPVVFALYWFLCQRRLRAQNTLVVVATEGDYQRVPAPLTESASEGDWLFSGLDRRLGKASAEG